MSDARLHVQINDYDTYQTHPLKLDQLYNDVVQVPIIRIFGSLSVGIDDGDERSDNDHTKHSGSNKPVKFLSYNVLVHVHNYYPYLYVDCFENEALLRSENYINQLVEYLENSLQQSFRRKKGEEEEEEEETIDVDVDSGGGKRKFIAKVAICKGSPIYGYQVGYKLFYKISLLSPLYKTRLTTLFHDKNINICEFSSSFDKGTKKSYAVNVYEAHIPYLLQFLADFNLFGCGWLEIDNTYFRYPILNDNTDIDTTHLKSYLKLFINHNNILEGLKFARIGRSLLEFDIKTESIHNRSYIKQRHLHHEFVENRSFNSGIPNNEIYLSSLNHIYKDLKYQCESRGSKMTESQFSQNNLGLGGTFWENQSDLNDLMNYVISLTKPSPTNKLDAYFKKFIESDKLSKFPTAFELIDIEKISSSSGGISLLNFNDDLIKWNVYSFLFEDAVILKDIATREESAVIREDDIVPDSKPSLDLEFDSDDFTDSEHVNPDDRVEKNDIDPAEHERAWSQPNKSDHEIMFEVSQRKRRRTSLSQTLEEGDSILQVPSSPHHLFNKITNPKQTNKLPDLMHSSHGRHFYEVLKPQALDRNRIMKTFDDQHLLKVNYTDPYYDKESDMPSRPMIFANKKISIPLINYNTLEAFKVKAGSSSLPMSLMIQQTLSDSSSSKIRACARNICSWRYVAEPPSKVEIQKWVAVEEAKMKYKRSKFRSQIEPPITQTNDYKFSYRSEKVSRRPNSFNSLTNFHLEIHVNTHNDLLPNPDVDPISVIFYTFSDSNHMFDKNNNKVGILIYHEPGSQREDFAKQLEKVSSFLVEKPAVAIFSDEKSMINQLIRLVECFDPDILSGYEINALSWGYVIERFRNAYDINLLFEFSRCKFKSNGKFGDRWGYTHTSAFKINGRHILNVWRLLRSELSLTNYSLENMSYHLLHQTLPRYLNFQLSQWYYGNDFLELLSVFKYYLRRVQLIMKIIDIQELITRNVEQSRLIGIDFNSNFYRGSQFKVESILCRLTKAENILLNSVSKQQVHEMRPLECIPLIMEPDSNFYKSPLIVLDFQSLYPSIMIAYNYCYSTILGKLHGFSPRKNIIGYLKNLKLPPGLVDLFAKNDGLNISPNGYVFVKSSIRKSMLAKMLEEILNARINVKSVMKLFKDDPELIKLYNSRQLALKLIANVTYGYTSATFSGRMPNSDIADAIVSTGREILSQSVNLIELTNYGAKVVYGDTDSLFVYLPGKTKQDAFKIGNELASFITDKFPDPIKLKFEKVYHPCVLLAKKRYVGYSYEYEDQQEPKFDAKGIETIRRDGIPAQQKMVEKTIRILFDTKNLSLIKKYTMEQFYKILINKVSIKDFCFAKEVRFGTYKNEAHLPPGAIVANRNVNKDPRNEPQYRERVPYVVFQDSSKIRVKDRCISPEDFIKSYNTLKPLSLDNEYYITRVLIPPLERVFNLIGVDIKGWYKELPKFNHELFETKNNIFQFAKFIKSNSCACCGSKLKEYSRSKYICGQCLNNELELIANLSMSSKFGEFKELVADKTCELCVNMNYESLGSRTIRNCMNECVNNSCLVYYNKIRVTKEKVQLDQKHLHLLSDLEW